MELAAGENGSDRLSLWVLLDRALEAEYAAIIDLANMAAAGDYVERPFLPGNGNDGFAGTEARSGKVFPHTSFPNRADRRHSGVAFH